MEKFLLLNRLLCSIEFYQTEMNVTLPKFALDVTDISYSETIITKQVYAYQHA
ncbi:protein of unknown function [Chryseobacterium sp. JV274]|nr:protein of unknown function [Chryseobacterium sp. JV274]